MSKIIFVSPTEPLSSVFSLFVQGTRATSHFSAEKLLSTHRNSHPLLNMFYYDMNTWCSFLQDGLFWEIMFVQETRCNCASFPSSSSGSDVMASAKANHCILEEGIVKQESVRLGHSFYAHWVNYIESTDASWKLQSYQTRDICAVTSW